MVKYRAEAFSSSLDMIKLTGRKRVKTSIILNKTHFRQHGGAVGSSDAAQLQGPGFGPELRLLHLWSSTCFSYVPVGLLQVLWFPSTSQKHAQ